MKSVHYSNLVDQKGNRKTLFVCDSVFDEIVCKCKGHHGSGGVDKNSFYVEVDYWNKCLEIVNDGILKGFYPYVKKETQIKIKA
jgi:hypothetical protein